MLTDKQKLEHREKYDSLGLRNRIVFATIEAMQRHQKHFDTWPDWLKLKVEDIGWAVKTLTPDMLEFVYNGSKL